MKTKIETIKLAHSFGVFGDIFMDAKGLACMYDCNVEFRFNGVNVVVNKHSDYQLAFDNYSKRIGTKYD